jgi:hypothetical protein
MGRALWSVIGILLCTISSAAAAQERKIKFEMLEPKSPQFKHLWKEAREDKSHGLEMFSSTFSKILKLPSALTISIEECGGKKAFYRAKDKKITLCYEVALDLERRSRKQYPKITERELADQIAGGAFLFLLFHEFGHALIDMLELKSGGREEDVADQVSMKMLLSMSAEAKGILSGVLWYFESGDSLATEDALADEHSLDKQRLYNIMCWTYGSDTDAFAYLAEEVQELRARATHCKDEYKKVTQWFEAAIQPHLDLQGIAEVQRTGATTQPTAQVPQHPGSEPELGQFEVAQGGFYSHPKYPAYVFTLLGAIVSMTTPEPAGQPSNWNALVLPESQWIPLSDVLGRSIPVMLMRSGEHLYARWMP